MIDPTTGQEVVIASMAPPPAVAPTVIPPMHRYAMPMPQPDQVDPNAINPAPLPLNVPSVLYGTTGATQPSIVPPGPPVVASVGQVAPGGALPAPMVPAAMPSALPPPVVAPGHANVAGPATSVKADTGQAVGDLQRASGDLQAATMEVGQANQEAGQAEAAARREQIAGDQAGLARHQETARQVQMDIQRINDNQRAVLDEARKTTIPDFWEGRTGAEVAGAISMALGTAGQAMTAFGTGINVGNTAKDIIDTNIKTYYARKKEEIDNLYKYAAQVNQLGQQEKADYASKLVALQYEIAATHQSAADHIMEVAAESKGRVALPQAAELAKQQAMSGVEHMNAARENAAKLQLEKRRLGIEGYNAQTARMREIDARDKEAAKGKGDDALVYDAQGKPFINAQTPVVANKFREQQRALADLGSAINELDSNYTEHGAVLPGGLTAASRQRAAIMSRITLAAKTVGELGALSGPDMGLVNDIAGGKMGQILGAKDGIGNLRKLRENGMKTSLSSVGAQPTPENLARFDLPTGQPTGQPAGQPAAQSGPAIGSRSTSGGKPIVYTASGWQLAAQ